MVTKTGGDELLIYILFGIAAIALLFGIKDIIFMLIWSWGENGKLITLYTSLLFIFIFLPVLTRSYAPKYHDASIILLIFYVILFLVLRFTGKFNSKHKEG